MSTSYDAIIVGSGAGGGTAARVFTQFGKNVLVLEKGRTFKPDEFLPYDELHFSEHKALNPSKISDPLVYVAPDGTKKNVERWWIANMVGGSTMVWEANLPRYTEEDFSLLKFMPEPPEGTSQVNWPWTYDEFQPWFELAEWEWGVSGQTAPVWDRFHKQERTREGYRFPMPPVRPHASTPFLTWAFGRAGMRPFPSPRGINTRTYDGRPACPYCGFCQGFGCAVSDRASSTNTVLAKALQTGRCTLKTGHCVTRIVHDKKKVIGVAYITEPGGSETVVKAPLVFVSIQAIESARLFLLSDIPNDNKLIGRYLTYHAKGSAELTFKGQNVWDDGPERLFQPRTSLGSLQMRDLYTIHDKKRSELSKGGKFSIYDPFTISPLIKAVTRTGLEPRKSKDLWGADLVDRLVEMRNQGGVMFSFTGETMSDYDNRVELDDSVKDPWGIKVARVYYKHHQYDLDISKYCLEKVCDIMVASGGELRKWEPQVVANEGYGHNHGTLRAGKDRESSVLDENCKSHSVDGLYVLDCAFMPTAGASNPTLTQIANAFRVCYGLLGETPPKLPPPTR